METLSFKELTIEESHKLSHTVGKRGEWYRLERERSTGRQLYTLVAYDAKQPVGFIICTLGTEDDVGHTTCEVTYVFVDESYRNRGIAKSMLPPTAAWISAHLSEIYLPTARSGSSHVFHLHIDPVSPEGKALKPMIKDAVSNSLLNLGYSYGDLGNNGTTGARIKTDTRLLSFELIPRLEVEQTE